MIRQLAPIAFLLASIHPARADDKSPAQPDSPVSFHRQVLPILQRKCQGCHQPAKANGKLNLTTFEAIKASGAGGPLFEPGKPGEGLLIENVTGKPPLMPPNAPNAAAPVIRNPKDDTVAIGGDEKIPRLYKIFRTQARDPSYTDFNLLRAFEAQPGPVSSLAFAPDGSKVATGGFDGTVRVFNVADGKLIAAFVPVPIAPAVASTGKD
jgi:Planctomycete cytochrome C/WD domain, G-beta repeat